jgi:ABC-2 type transport system permease protein
MFLSSLTESPIIAAVSSWAVLFFIYMIQNLLSYLPTSALSNMIVILILLSIVALVVYIITKNPVIAGGLEVVFIIASVVTYFVKSSLFESLLYTVLEPLILTNVFYNFAQNYLFDLSETSFSICPWWSSCISDHRDNPKKRWSQVETQSE